LNDPLYKEDDRVWLKGCTCPKCTTCRRTATVWSTMRGGRLPSQRDLPAWTYCLGVDDYGEEWVLEADIGGLIDPNEDPGPSGWA
jgi:hypothetical protein